MKAFALGLILIPVLVVAVLSVRPGGLRRQLRNVARRLRIALLLGGVYVVASIGLRLVPDQRAYEFGLPAAGICLAVAFVILAQDRRPAA